MRDYRLVLESQHSPIRQPKSPHLEAQLSGILRIKVVESGAAGRGGFLLGHRCPRWRPHR